MDILKKLWFSRANISKKLKLQLLNEGINLDSLYNYSYEKLFKLNISPKEINALEYVKNIEYYKSVISYMKKEDVRFSFITDEDYPENLRHIYEPPTGLFIKGQNVDFENSIAIVGARRASIYGKNIAKDLGRELSNHNITIVSGIALGVDAYAHIGALEGSGKTIAVIGSGLKYTYPNTNKYLYEEVLKTGCIVTEYFPEDPPMKFRFPERNRIISGISRGTVVIEAGEKSGSLITASLALQEGREVYALPGNITSPNSIGCNRLIKEGAKVVLGIEDILEDFDTEIELNNSEKLNLSQEENNVLHILNEGTKSFEEIHVRLNIPTHKLLAILGKLECIRIVKRLYGNSYSIYHA